MTEQVDITQATIQTEAPIKERKVEQLNPSRMRGAEYLRSEWVVTAHENTEPEDLLKPEYWAHVAADLRPWSKVEARANDGTWYAEYLVLEAGRNWARTVMLMKRSLTTQDVAMSQASMASFDVKYRGPHSKWSVIRIADNEVLHDGEETKDGAAMWLRERIKAGI